MKSGLWKAVCGVALFAVSIGAMAQKDDSAVVCSAVSFQNQHFWKGGRSVPETGSCPGNGQCNWLPSYRLVPKNENGFEVSVADAKYTWTRTDRDSDSVSTLVIEVDRFTGAAVANFRSQRNDADRSQQVTSVRGTCVKASEMKPKF